MRGSSESVDAESPCVAGFLERAVSDQSGAEEGSCGDIVERIGQRKDERGEGDGKFGVASIDRVAGKPRLVAEIFPACAAEWAMSASPSQPGNSYPLTAVEVIDGRPCPLDASNDFVTGNEWEFGFG
jgi:hypothetical protein